MLHEVLLALSGHPSPLFPASSGTDLQGGGRLVDKDFPLLSLSEAALLEAIGKLALLHRQTRAHAQKIVAEHPSVVCRAVASSLLHVHLARFQKKILDVESQILSKDADLVGAYNIVPLSAVVGEFDEWRRRMEWYWKLTCHISAPERSSSGAQAATGSVLVDYLRAESQTGFPDIEIVSIELSQVAERAWLKQLSVWLLYGQLPSHGASDFFVRVHESAEVDGVDTYTVSHELVPNFVSRRASGSLLFIGKSLHQIERHRQNSSRLSLSENAADAQLLSDHLKLLSALTLPLIPSSFSTAISRIRSSLSQKVLQKLLPIGDIKLSLNTFRQFFLLDRGEFAMTLIEQAQGRLNARQGDLGRFLHDDPAKNLQGVMMKEGEVTETLTRTWKTLTTAHMEDLEDDVFEFARTHIRLEIFKPADSRLFASDDTSAATPQLSDVAFNDLLLPVPTSLVMHIRSPLDLFISRVEVSCYASINAYLIALRRTHMRLSDLWRLTPARRDDPKASSTMRSRMRRRVASMRKVWATCSAAVFLLSETTAYFEGEVIKGAWDHFFQWVIKGTEHAAQQHDPETLASAHTSFLSSLTYALLLTDKHYTKTLRTLLANVEYLVAHFTRLQQIQKSLDLDVESGVEPATYIVEDERSATLELDRARKRVDSGMKDVVARLRQLDNERIGDAMFRGLRVSDDGDDGSVFEPWRGGGIERLLMKLDFGRITEDEMMFG